MNLVLGSGSPRRRELLAALGLAFEVRVREVDESPIEREDAQVMVARLAQAKLEAVMELSPDATVLAADTVVIVDGDVLGKPQSPEEGRAMLRRLAGRSHQVTTAVALGRGGQVLEVERTTTEVVFRPLTEAAIESYVAFGEGEDKAGGYGIQGRAGAFVIEIRGSYSNVVGLPMAQTWLLLERHGALP
ncbi:MAG: Maf family protein [Myxococcota bacterium]